MQESIAADVVLLWRLSDTRARYTRLHNAWNADTTNASAEQLRRTINKYLNGELTLDKEAVLNSLVDEHAPSFFANLRSECSKEARRNAFFQLSHNARMGGVHLPRVEG